MTRRPGITLVEVLVAILITSVGLLALLVLFPLGALEMVQAVQDDRSGHIKRSAGAMANIWKIRTDTDVTSAMLNPNNVGYLPYLPPGIPYTGVGLVAPPALSPRQVVPTAPPPKNSASANMSSYPVLVDPNGFWANYLAGNAAWRDWVAGGPNSGFVLPRRVTCDPLTPNSPTPSGTMATDPLGRRQQLLRWTTLLDDMTFPRDVDYAGRPCLPGGGNVVDRTPRYSWAYLCQMPKAIANNPPVYVSVIVYAGRALEQSASGERAFNAVYAFNGNANLVRLSWSSGQDPPDVSVGGWIFDATMTQPPHGRFYRVVSINQDSSVPNTMDVEVQTRLSPAGSNISGVAVIMDNVIEVFELQTF